MNILISAYSVNPYKGSEDSIGWSWVKQHEKHYKTGDRIILLTKKYNEKAVRKGFEEFGIKNIELVIVDVPNCLNWFREKRAAFHHMYYILWQKWAYKWVKRAGIKFDVIHHITMNDYRIPGQMWRVKDAYTVFGPAGGAQCTPKSLKFYEKNKAIAAVREMINKSCDYNPIYKRAIRGFDQIYAINGETQAQLERIAKKDVTLLPELALREDFKNVNVEHRKNDIFKIVFVGRLIAKKGVAFMLDVLSKMPNEFDWTVDIIGSGSEKTAIEKQIKELGLINKVFLRGNMPFAEVFRAYESADIFVLPSLRETSGNVLLEAMAYKLPIVALDTSFCTTLKEQGCGIFINTNQSLDKIQQGFVDAIVLLHDDEKLRLQLGENGYCYVNQELTWERKYQKIYLTDYSKCR